jgi:hypothetical protein
MIEKQIPTYDEALQMLADKASGGSVTAIVALERALRNRATEDVDEVGDAIDQILNRNRSVKE